jgi:TolA-binding protein
MSVLPEEPRRLLDGGGEGAESEAMRQLLARLDDPPAEDLARERIWRRMTAPRPASSERGWYLRMGAVTALMLALTAGLALRHRQANAFTLVKVGAEAELLTSPGSELDVGRAESEHLIRWSGSSLSAVVHGTNSPLSIEVGAYAVEVSAASFEVITRSAGEMTVSVSGGELEVLQGLRRWRVRQGEQWSSARKDAVASVKAPSPSPARPDRPPSPQTLPDEARKSEDQASPHLGASSVTSPAAPTGSPPPHRTEAPTAAHEPHRAAEARGEQKAPLAPVAEKTETAPPLVVAELEPAPKPVPIPPLVMPAPQAAPAPTPTPPQRYEEALDLERAGHYAEAAQRLQAVVAQHEPHADLALYELGRLEQRQLHDLPSARDAFSTYVSDYPHGSLQQEVRLSLIEVDTALSRSKEALSLASSFLESYPSSERAPDVRLLRANLLREQGRCDDALADYRQLVAHPTLGEEALFFTAWCQRQGDHLDDAEASLHDLLQRFPNGRYAAEARAALAGEK